MNIWENVMGDLRRRGDTQSTGEIEDRRLIAELLQNWVVWRDAGDWERFRAVWHPDGRMMATWTQGTGDEFIAISREGWAKGVSILHFLARIMHRLEHCEA
jgi:SnoaL-like domain